MTLKLYNTRTRQKENFEPLDEAKGVRMYVCGPTVYDFAHIGNARPLIVFDVLFRLLRHRYGADNVIYARNITDVEDKINARAKEEGISIRKLTERTTAQFHADVAGLACLAPTVEPRATGHIAEMISINERLIARGHAYVADGHVLFDVQSDPQYGKLARRSLDEMRAGARIEVAPYKRDAMDFVLWKPSGKDEPGWDSPWGRGRPGWHLECSAMAEKHLGEVFDIHGGGIDLVFPHHENETAQSTCAHGTPMMANIWMHNGHLQVEGEKMSKSLGNVFTIRDLLHKWPAEVIRFTMLSTHYRQPMDWTEDKVHQTRTALVKFSRQLQTWEKTGILQDLAHAGYPDKVMDALEDDLNTAAAIAALHELEADIRQCPDVGPHQETRIRQLANAFELLGLSNMEGFEARLIASQEPAIPIDTAHVETLIEARLVARNAKDWAEADRIRDELLAMGLSLKDAKDAVTGDIVTTWEIARS